MHKCIPSALRPALAHAVLKPKPKPHPLPPIYSRTIKTTPRWSATSPDPKKDQTPPHGDPPSKPPSIEDALAGLDPKDNTLLAPVHIPQDANAVLKPDHPATDILSQSGIVVQRQIEIANVLVGFEQANRYVLLDPHGNHIGFMAEHDGGIGKGVARQLLTTHRAFTTHVFDRHGKEVLRFHRPFSWIKTRIRVYDPLVVSPSLQTSSSTDLTPSTSTDLTAMQQLSSLPLEEMRVVGEVESQWAPLRRKYNLFLSHYPVLSEPGPGGMASKSVDDLSSTQRWLSAQQHEPAGAVEFTQFAAIDEPFLSWDFSLLDEDSRLIGSINRSFRGFAREIFTDTGSYVLRMDAAGLDEEAKQRHTISQTSQTEPAYTEAMGGNGGKYGLTLDQRALMLATAVNIDYDYFSRHSGGHGFMFPFWVGGGGEAAGAAGAGEAAGAAGAAGAGDAVGGTVIGGAGRAVGSAAGGVGAGEGAIAGAGTMAGYEAMQRGLGRSPQSTAPEAEGSSHEQPYSEPSDPSPTTPGASPHEQPYGEPYEPQLHDPETPQSGFGGQNESGDVWGPGSEDPWSGGAGPAESGGGEGSGLLQKVWDSFFD
ncbi:hypothetical protein A1O3_00515 [Capronia epimyces CBS 606.96]|uniref:Phospholipid scramblase n=1 Tax=Capronia epimyces CBS 606.96 TaxID=1182542 RepID=W9YQN2_9EURO|nr:uncharacterized protein A1O3_00515 [Capronia epimyces CBS 606.96]EXJ91965.1 hypothetical protein A1O3_00515 [Capronia epimyces CBS 606.96]